MVRVVFSTYKVSINIYIYKYLSVSDSIPIFFKFSLWLSNPIKLTLNPFASGRPSSIIVVQSSQTTTAQVLTGKKPKITLMPSHFSANSLSFTCIFRTRMGVKKPHIGFLTWWNQQINVEIGWKSTGWWFEPLWKILVNWDDYSQYMGT